MDDDARTGSDDDAHLEKDEPAETTDPTQAVDPSDRTTVIVTVDGNLTATLPALREAGLRIERTMLSLSIVVGTVDEDGERAIASIRGVHIERDQVIRLDPPGGPQ